MKKVIFITYIALLVFQETKGIYEHFKSSFYIGEYSSCPFFYLFLFKGKMLILIPGAGSPRKNICSFSNLQVLHRLLIVEG